MSEPSTPIYTERCEARAYGKYQCVYDKGHTGEHRDETGMVWHVKSMSTSVTTPKMIPVDATYTTADLERAKAEARLEVINHVDDELLDSGGMELVSRAEFQKYKAELESQVR